MEIKERKYESPSTDHFVYDTENKFHFIGTGLKGAKLHNLKGKAKHSGADKDVKWKHFDVIDNTSDTDLYVKGTPENPQKHRHEEDTDPGDVTPTLDGGSYSKTLPADYGP